MIMLLFFSVELENGPNTPPVPPTDLGSHKASSLYWMQYIKQSVSVAPVDQQGNSSKECGYRVEPPIKDL